MLVSVLVGGPNSSRCRFRCRVPQFFAAAASVRLHRTRHETHGLVAAHAGHAYATVSVAEDPLRLSAEGAQPDVALSDVLCRLVSARVRAPNPSRSPAPVRLAPDLCLVPRGQGPLRIAPVRSDAFLNPERLRSVRSSTCDRGSRRAFPVTFLPVVMHRVTPRAHLGHVNWARASALSYLANLGHLAVSLAS
jgi:hypothetical protein